MRWTGKIHQFALWDDYYQPHRRSSGHGDGGFANLVEVLLGRGASIDLPDGYVFISYHHGTDGVFVQHRLRPLLSRAGLPSWAYRASERIPDEIVEVRLDELVRRAGVVLVVTTRHWSTFWSNVELEAAHRHGIPVLAVRPAEEPASNTSNLAGVPSLILSARSRSGSALLATLERARRSPGADTFTEPQFVSPTMTVIWRSFVAAGDSAIYGSPAGAYRGHRIAQPGRFSIARRSR